MGDLQDSELEIIVKIRTIQFNNHKLLGNLRLDFVDLSTDKPFDTVILAGENGSGKTFILEEIYSTLGEPDLDKQNRDATLELQTDGNDLQTIRERLNASNLSIPSERITAQYSYHVPGSWHNLSIKLTNQEGEVNRNAFDYLGRADDKPKPFRVFLSEAALNFQAHEIDTVGASGVDANVGARRGGAKLAEEITQLLVDIRAADNEDLAKWCAAHPGAAPLPDVHEKRMKRFREAIEFMFPNKRFKTVSRESGKLRVEFEEHGKTTTLNELSTGEKQIVFRGGFLLRDLASVQGGIFLIDEPELSLHPNWQARILGFYQRLLQRGGGATTQLIVATHSPFVVHDQPSAKVVILKRNQDTGAVEVDPEPSYPTSGQARVIHSLNVEALIERSQHDLVVLVEGETDKTILGHAWSKLYPGVAPFFELRAALGHTAIRTILNEAQVFKKNPTKKLVGLFDFDTAFSEWKGTWNNTKKRVVVDPARCLVKKHDKHDGWVMLLPVPANRSHLANERLGAASALSIELLFQDGDHLPGMILQEPLPAPDAFKPRMNDTRKVEFAEHVKHLPAASFDAFKPIFDRWRDIRDGRL